MSDSKLHHYVPQFYLRRFADSTGKLWLWDKGRDRIFTTKPKGAAAENYFYYQDYLLEQGHDPLTIEKQFSEMETDVALITEQWLHWILNEGRRSLEVPKVNREIVSLYIALQFLRTADHRDIISKMLSGHEKYKELSIEDARRLHIDILWSDEIFSRLAARIEESTWIFGLNKTDTPFVTSDNPVAFKTHDNVMWLKAAIYTPGTYAMIPLSPSVILYCHPNEAPWENLLRFNNCVSPVLFTQEMVDSDNCGQVFMASSFVISARNSFENERSFAKSIGTDMYRRELNSLK